MKKKIKATVTSDVGHLAAMESGVFGQLHSLVAHCAATKYDDGDPRKTGWITIKTMGSAWVVEAKDADTCCKLSVIQATLDEALMLLSMLLESDEAPWEADQWLQQSAQKAARKK